ARDLLEVGERSVGVAELGADEELLLQRVDASMADPVHEPAVLLVERKPVAPEAVADGVVLGVVPVRKARGAGGLQPGGGAPRPVLAKRDRQGRAGTVVP